MSSAVGSRLSRLETVYDTSDRVAAAAQIRRICAGDPVLAPHTERMVQALLSHYPQYEVCVPEGSINPVCRGRGDTTSPRCEAFYLISWWQRASGGPMILRGYFLDDKRPAPEPPVPEPEPPPALSAYERLMAGATEGND